MSGKTSGLAHSVHTRLIAHAKKIGVDPNLVLARYAVERYLYRLSRSPHAEHFVLKGALLMLVWLGETIRPTRDADLLAYGDVSQSALAEIFREVCLLEVEPDGMEFLPDTIASAAIREEDPYGGQRITLQGRLGAARLRVQVDVGIGDAVTPEPEWMNYPSLLGLPAARLRAYHPETTIAEKLHAMIVLGSKNSRMRNFFDIYQLARRRDFDGFQLVASIRDTFQRRKTKIPELLPLALTLEFTEVAGKQAQNGKDFCVVTI